jgi:C4-type Zn-finger protein
MVKAAYKVVYGCGHVFYSQTPRIAMPCPTCGYRTCNVYMFEQEAPADAQFIGATIMRFQAQISRFGPDRYIINIPKALHMELQPLLGKTVTVTLEG